MTQIEFEDRPFPHPMFVSDVPGMSLGSRILKEQDVIKLQVKGFPGKKGECRVRIDSVEKEKLIGTVEVSTSYTIAGGPEILKGTVVEFRESNVFSWV